MANVRGYQRRPGAKFIRKTEESEQQRFVIWFRKQFPGVIIYTDFAAGLPLSDNERMRMIRQRSRDGMPDIYIDFPTMHIHDGKEVYYHGCRLEFKKTGTTIYKADGELRKSSYRRVYKNGFVKSGDHLQEQADTLQAYNDNGYFARFVKGLDHAKEMASWYMGAYQTGLFDDGEEF